jgi:hypothetical protein
LLAWACRFGHRLAGPMPDRKTEIRFVFWKLMPWQAAWTNAVMACRPLMHPKLHVPEKSEPLQPAILAV